MLFADGCLLQFPLNLRFCQLLENLLHGLVAHIEPFQNNLRTLSPGHGIAPFSWFMQPSFVVGAPKKQKAHRFSSSPGVRGRKKHGCVRSFDKVIVAVRQRRCKGIQRGLGAYKRKLYVNCLFDFVELITVQTALDGTLLLCQQFIPVLHRFNR